MLVAGEYKYTVHVARTRILLLVNTCTRDGQVCCEAAKTCMKNIVLAQLTKTAQHVLHTVTALHTVSVYTVSAANNSSTVAFALSTCSSFFCSALTVMHSSFDVYAQKYCSDTQECYVAGSTADTQLFNRSSQCDHSLPAVQVLYSSWSVVHTSNTVTVMLTRSLYASSGTVEQWTVMTG